MQDRKQPDTPERKLPEREGGREGEEGREGGRSKNRKRDTHRDRVTIGHSAVGAVAVHQKELVPAFLDLS